MWLWSNSIIPYSLLCALQALHQRAIAKRAPAPCQSWKAPGMSALLCSWDKQKEVYGVVLLSLSRLHTLQNLSDFTYRSSSAVIFSFRVPGKSILYDSLARALSLSSFPLSLFTFLPSLKASILPFKKFIDDINLFLKRWKTFVDWNKHKIPRRFGGIFSYLSENL